MLLLDGVRLRPEIAGAICSRDANPYFVPSSSFIEEELASSNAAFCGSRLAARLPSAFTVIRTQSRMPLAAAAAFVVDVGGPLPCQSAVGPRPVN